MTAADALARLLSMTGSSSGKAVLGALWALNSQAKLRPAGAGCVQRRTV